MRRVTLVSILCAALLCAVAAHAEHTRFWSQSTFDEFEKGTHKGVALRSDGMLMPAPDFKSFADPNLAYVWALVVDSRGRVYAAGGSDAKVVRLSATEKPVTVFESTELEAQALAVDKSDNLYVGTSPDGKIYKITPDGQHTVFFDPKSKYIWALAFDSHGVLFAGTGDKGDVFAVAPDGKGQLFYKSEESHARSLAFDRGGNLLIGTDPSGLIIRVPVASRGADGIPTAGSAFVIYETAKKEVTALTTDADGNIYASAVGNKPIRQTGAFTGISPAASQLAAAFAAAAARSASNAQQPAQNAANPAAAAAMPPLILPTLPNASGGSEVYRIATDGSPESLWSSPQDIVYSLAFSPENHLLLGTGNHGEVIELDGNLLFSSLATADASQVTSLVAGPGHAIYVATANPGKIFTLGPAYAAEGTFTSDTFDAKIFSHWGRLTWWGDNSSGKIEFYARSGNTSDPDNYWSPWAGPYSNLSGETVQCPPARFIQWKAVFQAAGSQSQPTLSWVKLAYLRKNVAPVIDGIAIQDPGLRAQGFPGQAAIGSQPTPVQLRAPRTGRESDVNFVDAGSFQQREPRFSQLPQGFSAKGYQTVVWAAHDDNDDEIVYSLYYRGEGEKDWKLLKENIHSNYYSWDTNSMPDGAYYLKLVASDAPSNPQGQALTAEMVSDRFQIDNTPPAVENIHAEPSSGDWHVRFTAHDAGSAISRASYSVDAGTWQTIFPVGQLTDAPVESYDIALQNLKPGEHTVAVRVFDQFENTAAGKVTFTIPGAH
ncbi:MAG TPA: hypothetical protein VGR81_13510 [Candidatus Acidoferrales bacterium]|nr:hypothetical protein [Candidatus Acidoferrales bacterium]